MLHAGEELKQDIKLTGQRGRTTGVAQVSLPLLLFVVLRSQRLKLLFVVHEELQAFMRSFECRSQTELLM